MAVAIKSLLNDSVEPNGGSAPHGGAGVHPDVVNGGWSNHQQQQQHGLIHQQQHQPYQFHGQFQQGPHAPPPSHPVSSAPSTPSQQQHVYSNPSPYAQQHPQRMQQDAMEIQRRDEMQQQQQQSQQQMVVQQQQMVQQGQQQQVAILSTSKNSVCNKCGLGFPCDSLRRKHEARHTKPYKCPMKSCQRHTVGFTSKNDLARHNNSVHKGNTAVGYNCKYGQCREKKKIYYRLDNFRNHLKKLHSPRRHGESDGEFLKRAELECRTEDSGSAMDMSGAETDTVSLAHNGVAAQSDTESLAGSATPARVPPSTAITTLVVSPTRSRRPQTSSSSVFVNTPHYEPESTEMEPNYPERAQTESPGRRARRTRKDEIREEMERLRRELEQLEEQDAIGYNGHPEDYRQSYAVTRFMEDQEGVPYGYNPDAHGNNHRYIQDYRYDDRIAQADMSASSTNMPSPPETVDDSLPPGGLTRDGSPRPHEDHPLPVLAPESRNFGVPVTMAPGRNPKPIAVRNRETQDRTFVCPRAGCKSSFHRECELRKHARRHDRPYECTFHNCKSTFGSKNDWKRHESSQHHRVEMWKCQIPTSVSSGASASTQVCGKVYYRKENYINHLKSTLHTIKTKSQIDDWVNKCYLSGCFQQAYWCGFCHTPEGRKGVEVKVKQAANGKSKTGPEGLDERYDHVADHFEKGLTMADWIHENDDFVLDDSSSMDEDDDDAQHAAVLKEFKRQAAIREQHLKIHQQREAQQAQQHSALAGLADLASAEKRAGVKNQYQPTSPVSSPPPLQNQGSASTTSPNSLKRKAVESGSVFWYCCDPDHQHKPAPFPVPNLVDQCDKCLDCGHERCRNCASEMQHGQRVKERRLMSVTGFQRVGVSVGGGSGREYHR